MQTWKIKKFCDEYFGYDISKYNQSEEAIKERWIYYLLCYKYSYASNTEIGKRINRKHVVVGRGLKAAEDFIKVNKCKPFLTAYKSIESEFVSKFHLSDKYFEFEGLTKIQQNRQIVKLTAQLESERNRVWNLKKKIDKVFNIEVQIENNPTALYQWKSDRVISKTS